MNTADFLTELFGRVPDGLAINVRPLVHNGDARNLFYPTASLLVDDPTIAKLNETHSIYVGVALRDAGHERPGTKAGCAAITSLWADLDAKDFLKAADPKNVTIKERADGKQLIREALAANLPENLQPSLLVDTGGGYQVYWLLDKPLAVDPESGNVGRVEATLAGLINLLGADKARKDVSSVMRLPGTVNCKYPDRPLCAVVEEDIDRRYDLADFAQFIEQKATSTQSSAAAPVSPDAGRDFPALFAWIKGKGWYLKKAGEKHLITCPWKADHTGNSGVTETALYGMTEDNGYAGGFKCQHAHCADRRIGDLYLMWRAERAASEPAEQPLPPGHRNFGGIISVNMASVASKDPEWLWPGRVPLGMLTIIAGPPGVAKSYVSLDVAARTTIGRVWPDIGRGAPQGAVILLAAEDHPQITIKPRLDTLRADCGKIELIKQVWTVDGRGKRHFSLADDMVALERMATETGARLIIVDPVNSYLGGKQDGFKDTEVRTVLEPMKELAERLGIAVVLIMHTKKGQENEVIYQIGGSVGFAALVRSIMFCTRDPECHGRFYFTHPKINIAPEKPTLAYTITEDKGVVWGTDPIKLSAREILASQYAKPGPKQTARLDVKRWLMGFLADGPRPSVEGEREASGHGFSDKTLRRAMADLGVVSTPLRLEDGTFTGHAWALAPVETRPF